MVCGCCLRRQEAELPFTISKDFRRVSEILVVAVAVCTDAIHHGRMDWELPRGHQFVLYFWDFFVLFDDIDTSQQVLSVLRGQVVFTRFFSPRHLLCLWARAITFLAGMDAWCWYFVTWAHDQHFAANAFIHCFLKLPLKPQVGKALVCFVRNARMANRQSVWVLLSKRCLRKVLGMTSGIVLGVSREGVWNHPPETWWQDSAFLFDLATYLRKSAKET